MLLALYLPPGARPPSGGCGGLDRRLNKEGVSGVSSRSRRGKAEPTVEGGVPPQLAPPAPAVAAARLSRVLELTRTVLIETDRRGRTAYVSAGLDAVVGFAPTDVVWAGVRPDGSVTSHWTLDGSPLPFVPFDDGWDADSEVPAYVGLYEASRERFPDTLVEAAIPVEKIGRLVLVGGADDKVWPALEMARVIEARRRTHGLRRGPSYSRSSITSRGNSTAPASCGLRKSGHP